MHKTLPVSGMHCASCASIIKKKLEKIDGVESCVVNVGTQKAQLSFDPQKVTISQMNAEIGKLGYELMDTQHDLTDMKMSDHSNHSAHSDHSAHKGHEMMTPISSDASTKKRKLEELKNLRQQLTIVLPMTAVSILMMVWEIGVEPLHMWPNMPQVLNDFFHHVLPIFATYTLFVVGIPYLKGMVRFFKYRVANMDTLVGIGTSTAFLYSFMISAFAQPLAMYLDTNQSYYDVTIAVISFITLGKFLEARAKLRTGEAIEKLLNLQAKKALVIRDGQEQELPIEEIVIGDVVLVKPGEKIPLDGVILEGKSPIDESMITGESMPVEKGPHDAVIGATINKHGSLQVRVTKIGAQTMLAQIISMVEEAQSSKAPIERLADQVSEVFVPIVLLLAVITLLVWLVVGSQFLPISQAISLGLLSFVGILVIACPCAMGLATPTAIIVGVGKAAQHGILIKNAESLEKFHAVDFVVLDKTGTLTNGNPEVTDVRLATKELAEKDVLTLLASLEKHSEHPLAQAIVKKAQATAMQKLHKVENFAAIEGKGLEGKIGKTTYFAGNVKLARQLSLEIDESVIHSFTAQGKTPVLLMTKKLVFAYVALADTLKMDAKTAVAQLHAQGIRVAMLTGDHRQTAEYIGKQANIDRVIAEVLPKDKAMLIRQLQQEGHIVAMVGDGINDAPALATADVGVAMGTGTDIAIASAGITLLGGHLSKLPQAIKLAQDTMRIIRQNLFWAFFYNVIGIPLAAGVLYPFWGILLNPAIAGAAMGLSSFSVVTNSLRLKSKKLLNN
jgi:Cu2+-exporting ATPase/Cu+-exporting ATPase